MDRRLFLAGSAALAGAGWRPARAAAQVIVGNDTEYVIDCGDGVARQIVLAGFPRTTPK